MRVHVVKLGVVAALVAAVVAQTASAHELTAAVPASEKLPAPVTTSPVTLAQAVALAAVPDARSFDDAHGGVGPGVVSATSTVVAARRPVAPRKPPKPPTKARSGALPASGTPQAILAAAYVKAASKASTGCHLKPAHLAAIGQVESGSVGGRRIDADHRVSPGIYGPLLDGGPFAVVRDSDGGRYDGAGDYDRAVGPLQFLPGTWRWAGRDGDGDGRRDPQNVFDAALATADYLCRDGRDLSRAGDLRGAILTYNWSGEYVAAVTQWVGFFSRHGLAALDDVAFRVGSGGRASSMAVPTSAKDKEKAKAKAKAKSKAKATTRATTTPRPTTTRPGTPTTTRPPSPTTTPDPSTTTPAPDPTTPDPVTPAPDPTTPEPDPTTPDPVIPDPEPSTPAPASTTPPATSSTPSTR